MRACVKRFLWFAWFYMQNLYKMFLGGLASLAIISLFLIWIDPTLKPSLEELGPVFNLLLGMAVTILTVSIVGAIGMVFDEITDKRKKEKDDRKYHLHLLRSSL